MNIDRLTPDALRTALQREQQIVEMANQRRPALAAARTGLLIKNNLPDAATLVFAVTDDCCDGFRASLEAILDADARLLWHGDVPVDSAAALDLIERGGPVDDGLVDTDGAEYQMLIEGTDLHNAGARPLANEIVRRITTGEPPQLVGIDIAEAIRFAALIIAPVAVTVAELARMLPTYTAILDADDVQPLIAAVTADVAGGDTVPLPPPDLVGQVCELLRDWRHYDDAALIGLIERALAHHGAYSDDDYEAATQRRSRYEHGLDPELRAYDGSNCPQKRALTGRDRDILVRVLNDILYGLADPERRGLVQRVIRFGGDNDVERLREMSFVLDPRDCI